MDKPYDDWRANSYTEQAAYDSLNKSANVEEDPRHRGHRRRHLRARRQPGRERRQDHRDDRRERPAIQSGFEDSADSKIHKAALEELAESFGADVSELIVDVDGKIIELKGSAEEQFQQWRALLREIALADVALPVDINVTAAPAPPAEAEPPPPPAEVVPVVRRARDRTPTRCAGAPTDAVTATRRRRSHGP